ncbi:MAG: hypothetical protein KatS3mg115_1928 [Candidatus Poribacteria bacterium]|nr:MAG: hypothetical protein KatS3mg115_1928 [Candidatus Poribacteria bacterium]
MARLNVQISDKIEVFSRIGVKSFYFILTLVSVWGLAARGAVEEGLLLYLDFEAGWLERGDLSPSRHPVEGWGALEEVPGPVGFGTALELSSDPTAVVRILGDLGAPEVLTIAFWCWFGDPKPDRWDYLFDVRSDQFQEAEGAFFFGRNRAGELRFGDLLVPADGYPRREWVHLVVTVERGRMRVTLNGLEVAAGPAVGTNLGDRVRIGNRFTEEEAFFGRLDEFALWNRLLDDEELLAIVRRPVLSARPVRARAKLPLLWGDLKRGRR